MRRAFAVIIVLIILWGVASLTAKSLNGINLSLANNIVIIPINGFISVGDSSGMLSTEEVTSTSVINYLEKAEKDMGIKGIILEINSGGGDVVASKEIAEKVKAIKKPVVALIREVGASGAYWVASAADKIVADSLSITGSIGVRGSYLEFSELMEKYGIKYQSLAAGKYKDTGSPYKELTDEEKTLLQNKIDLIHEKFVEAVSENRKVNLKPYATGMFFLGEEAVKIGMIDYLGNKETAINVAKELAKIKEAKIVTYKKKRSFREMAMEFLGEFGNSIGVGIGNSFKAEEGLKVEA